MPGEVVHVEFLEDEIGGAERGVRVVLIWGCGELGGDELGLQSGAGGAGLFGWIG